MIQLAIHEKPPLLEGKQNPVHAIGSLTDLGGHHLGANHHGTLAPTFNLNLNPQLVPKYYYFKIPKHLTSKSQFFPHDDALDKNTPA